MFTSPLKTKAQRLKSKDVKALRKTLHKQYPHLTTEDIDVLCPTKAFVDELKLKNKDVMYAINPLGKKSTTSQQSTPYFYQHRNKTVMPTLFALWRMTKLLRCNFFTPTFVSSKLIKDPPADLFLPGVAVARDKETHAIVHPWAKNDYCALYVFGNPLPFAIGRCACSSDTAIQNNMTGVAATVVHYFGDMLWSMSPLVVPDGFYVHDRIDRTVPLPAKKGDEQQEGEREGAQECKQEDPAPDVQESTSCTPTAPAATFVVEGVPLPLAPSSFTPGETKHDSTADNNITDTTTTPSTTTTTTMDQNMMVTLLLTLSNATKSNFPVLANVFMSKMYLTSRPVHPTPPHSPIDIQVKQSSYKKFSTFLKHCSHNEHLLDISETPDGNGGTTMTIVSCNRSAPLLKAFDASQYTMMAQDNVGGIPGVGA
jgi:predicted ribosome-associated RNA-binding protein Tma20